MAATSLAATSSIPTSELRSGSRERNFIVEHDGALRKILHRLLSSEGYVVDAVLDAACGLESLQRQVPPAIILDLPRPGSSGRSLQEDCEFDS